MRGVRNIFIYIFICLMLLASTKLYTIDELLYVYMVIINKF